MQRAHMSRIARRGTEYSKGSIRRHNAEIPAMMRSTFDEINHNQQAELLW